MDVALGRVEFGPSSRAVLDCCQHAPQMAVVVAWHTVSNLFYMLRAARSDSFARAFVGELLEVADVVAGSRKEVRQALRLEMKDFEDALQIVAGVAAGVKIIVTRNLRHYQASPIPALAPVAFLRRFANAQQEE